MAKDEGSTGVLLVTDENVQWTMPTDELFGSPCVCGRTFTSEKGMKIHRPMKRCTNPLPEVQKRTVAATAGESSEDYSKDQPHSAMNTKVVLSREATAPSFERPDGSRIKVRFPPAAYKTARKKIDSEMSQVLGNELQK